MGGNAGVGFECLRCGNCCVNIRVQVTREDVESWIKKKRFDVLRHVIVGVCTGGRFLFVSGEEYAVKFLGRGAVFIGASAWYDGDSDSRLFDCPFLEKEGGVKASCAIYDLRPQACRNFPSNLVEDGKPNLKTGACMALVRSSCR